MMKFTEKFFQNPRHIEVQILADLIGQQFIYMKGIVLFKEGTKINRRNS